MKRKTRKKKMYRRSKNHCGRPHKKYARRNPETITARAAGKLMRSQGLKNKLPAIGRCVRLADGRDLCHDGRGYYLAGSTAASWEAAWQANRRSLGGKYRNPSPRSSQKDPFARSQWLKKQQDAIEHRGRLHGLRGKKLWKFVAERMADDKYGNPHPSGLSYGEQIQRAWKQQKKKGDHLGMLYYETFGPKSSGLASWEAFKGSWAGQEWIKKQKQSNPKTNTGARAMTTVQALRLSPRKLGAKLQEWHGGGGSGLYAVGSTLSATGKLPSDASYVAAAIRELINLKKDANFPETVTAGDVQETKALATAIRMLQKKGF